jgi:peroxiredoxin
LADLTDLKLKPDEALWEVTIEPPKKTREFLAQTKKQGKEITFPILSDGDRSVIQAFGLGDPRYVGTEHEGIPYAAVYIVEKSGRVAWARVSCNYKTRPTNEKIRAVLDSL